MATYSVDHRQEILQEHEYGARSQRESAELYHASLPSLSRSCSKSASPTGSNRNHPLPVRATGLHIVATPYMGGHTALDAIGNRQCIKNKAALLPKYRY